MAKGFKAGSGGGAPLNFKVVGGTSAPSNPKENTIWVNTAKEITGWHFSATQPENPVEGMVWFAVSTSSCEAEFNALKKNGIQVYPSSAKQYDSGAWVSVTAETYQGGEWVSWSLYVYKMGEQSSAITGGWKLYFEAVGSTKPTATYESDHLLINKPELSRGVVGTINKVDFGSKKTLYLDHKKLGNGKITLCVYAQAPTDSTSSVGYVDIPVNSTRNTISLDISSLNGSPVYVGFKTNSPNEWAGLYIFNIWAE